MVKSNKPTPSKESNGLDTYKAVGIIFLIGGLLLMFMADNQVSGVPFLILGATFLALTYQDSARKPKK